MNNIEKFEAIQTVEVLLKKAKNDLFVNHIYDFENDVEIAIKGLELLLKKDEVKA